MAPAKLDRIVSVTSEDPAFPAENLLKNSYSDKKWKCKTVGEKQICVVIQLEKAERITAVDVGNYGSAFVEILVSKSSNPDDFKVLIVTSSLMTLQEAKTGSNISNVRFFKEDSIDKTVASEKWDRVKVICSQPYNKILQYGLAFLVIHTAGASTSEKDVRTLGNFQLKKAERSDSLTVGSLFAKRKKTPSADVTGAAAIRVASTTGVNEKKILPNVAARPKESSAIESKDKTKEQEKALRKNANKDDGVENRKKKHRGLVNGSSRDLSPPIGNVGQTTPNRGRTQSKESSKRPAKPRLEKPFNRLFEGVVFTISGFQNPFRSTIRSKAIEMGAKYRPDWDNTCTHLLCAFPNTPKFNQVLGHGKIITKEWIETCYNRRMKIPWRRHALYPPDKTKAESEDEIFEQVERPPSPVDNRRRVSPERSSSPDTEEEVERVLERQRALNANKEAAKKPGLANPINGKKLGSKKENEKDSDNSTQDSPKRKATKTESPNRNKTRTESFKKEKRKGSPVLNVKEEDSDEVSTILPKRSALVGKKLSPLKKRPKKAAAASEEIPESTYDLDTEEEDEECDSKKFNLPHLATFFQGLAFHIGGDLAPEEHQEVRRYILAHKGTIVQEDDLSFKDVDYHISVTEEEVKKIRELKTKVTSVKPEWIWKAHDEARIPPTRAFEFN